MRRSTKPSTRMTNLPRLLCALGLTFAFPLGSIAGCSSSNQVGGDPCLSKYKGQCGGACKADADCKTAGLYCSPETGKCTADCPTSGAPCGPEGNLCTNRGRCEPGGSLFGPGGGGPSFTDAGSCATDQRRGEGLPADIYIMNDQSQS